MKRERVNIEEELDKLERKERKRRSPSVEEGDGAVRAIKRAAQKRRAAGRFSTKIGGRSRSRSGSSHSHSSSEESSGNFKKPELTLQQREALAKTREEYNNLRADLLQFKQTKIGTNLDETNINI